MRKFIRVSALVSVALLAVAGRAEKHQANFTVSSASARGLDHLDDFIARTMKNYKIPGLAIAVVQDGKLILSKGYGSRDMEKNLPVTPQDDCLAVGGQLLNDGRESPPRKREQFACGKSIGLI